MELPIRTENGQFYITFTKAFQDLLNSPALQRITVLESRLASLEDMLVSNALQIESLNKTIVSCTNKLNSASLHATSAKQLLKMIRERENSKFKSMNTLQELHNELDRILHNISVKIPNQSQA